MLRQRVITAVVLLPVVIGVILLAPRWLVLALLAFGLLAAAREWAPLSGLRGRWTANAYTALVAAGMLLGLWWLQLSPPAALPVLGVAAAWWGLALLLILFRPRVPVPLSGLAGLLALVPAWLAAVTLYDRADWGPAWLLLVMVLVWAADVGAYFAGHLLGRRKLAPAVSPGKTWEGVAGGVLAAMLCAAAGAWWFERQAAFLLVCFLAVCASIVGDLTESLFKRQAGLKDSGALLPGHGGVLDRLDSLLAALPVFTLGLLLLEAGA